MAMVGANPKALRDTAADLRRRAAAVDHARATVNGKLYSVDWRGPAANRFRSRWRNELSPRLSRVRDEMYGMANQLSRQADQQERASRARTSHRITMRPCTDSTTGWTPLDGLDGAAFLIEIASVGHRLFEALEAMEHLESLMRVKKILTNSTLSSVKMHRHLLGTLLGVVITVADLGLTIARTGFDSPETWYGFADAAVVLTLATLTGPAAPLAVLGWTAASSLLKATGWDVKVGGWLKTSGRAVGGTVVAAASSIADTGAKVVDTAQRAASGFVGGARNLMFGGWNLAANAFGW